MGRFVNPDNSAFQVALNSDIYVDKSGLLTYINGVMDTDRAFICNSRPRRFGKSITANMLVAYYSRGCNSEKMFQNLAISRSDSFGTHLNRYDVIHFDVQWCQMDAGSPAATVDYINSHILAELMLAYPNTVPDSVKTAYGAMSWINASTGTKFIVVIDEWDALIRDEEATQAVQNAYINFLRGMFKGNEPTRFIRLAYLTGILPIKKVRTQSALNNFDEFTMLDARVFAPYIGFTEDEVRHLCEKYRIVFEDVKRWYDGYLLEDCQVYNPKAVVSVMIWNKFQSYWSKTGTYESIMPLIGMNFDGLKTAVIEMLSGVPVPVDISFFQNDPASFRDKDDVLTFLIHLGYLSYSQKTRTVCIPNEEIRQEFISATKRRKWNELIELQNRSDQLLAATLEMDAETVAEEIERLHQEYAPAIQYNNESSLGSVLTIAYLGAMQYYFKPMRELPTGKGFADFVFIPKAEYASEYPALLIELKWNQSAETAIRQIIEKDYPAALRYFSGDVLLVGINYDKKTRKHNCMIEKLVKREKET